MKTGKMIFLFVLVSSLFCVSAFALPYSTNGNNVEQIQSTNVIASDRIGVWVIAESENLKLSFDYDNHILFIENMKSHFIWSSAVDETYYGGEKPSKALKAGLSQLLNVSYTDFNANSGMINTGSSNCTTRVSDIPNGVRLDFSFTEMQFGVSLEVSLDNDQLEVRIPSDLINQDGAIAITSIDVLPMLGAPKNGEDGYIFYPDGSGVLYNLKNKTDSGTSTLFSADLYSNMSLDMNAFLSTSKNGTQTLMMPVYGIKRGDNALFGVIMQGDEYCSLSLAPSGFIYKISRIYPSIRYRKSYIYKTGSNQTALFTEKETPEKDFEIHYYFLNDDKANYSGMAEVYRTYLQSNGLIKKNTIDDKDYPISLDFFMTAKEKTILWDNTITMTTFSQAAEILSELKDGGIRNMQTMLLGWQNNGFGVYPSYLPVSGAAGGDNGLKSLGKYAAENKFNLYLSQNYLEADNSRRGFSKYNDVIYNLMSLPMTDKDNTKYFLNMSKTYNKFASNDIDVFKTLGISGIAFETMGTNLVEDYKDGSRQTRYEVIKTQQSFLQQSLDHFSYAAVNGANAYLLKYATRLFDTPDTDSKYFGFDNSVPFYQMVVHGSIPYTSQVPGNLSSDFQQQKLKWVEYGSMPYFIVTNDDPSKLKNSYCKYLLSSKYSDWKEEIENTAKEFNVRLAGLQAQTMTNHTMISEDVALIEYSYKTQIVVNYGDKDFLYKDNVVKSRDYLVVTEQGGVR